MTTTSQDFAAAAPAVPIAATAPGPITFVVLTLWLAAVLVAVAAGAFADDPGELPLGLIAGVALPVGVFGAAYRFSSRFRAFVLGLDLGLITAFQAWRVVGTGFLFLYAWDVLPGFFAFPAGLGDLAVGLAAPFFVAALYNGGASRRSFVLWNWLGLADFVVAFAAGLLVSGSAAGVLAGEVTTAPLNLLPLVLIPGLAVPVFILMHAVALLQLRQPSAAADPVVVARRG